MNSPLAFPCPLVLKTEPKAIARSPIDAIQSASKPHRFLSVTKAGDSAIVATKGNETCHVILRGGKSGPNFDGESVARVRKSLEDAGLDPSIMIDCSHANSDKDYKNQPAVCAKIGAQIATGDMSIRSIMIESHLKEGSQKINSDPSELDYGVSVTDSCVGWETTEEMIRAVGYRRSQATRYFSRVKMQN